MGSPALQVLLLLQDGSLCRVVGLVGQMAQMWMPRVCVGVPCPPDPTPTMPPILTSSDDIQIAADRLRVGDVVAIPSETVYGLAGLTRSEAALDRIYALKGRPSDNPLIAHVGSIEMAVSCVETWPDEATALAEAFWPGPLSLILPRADWIPDRAVGGHSTVAVRWPDHSVMQSLLEILGEPLSAPSANRSGQVSPTTAAHVVQDYADVSAAASLMVLDGGPCRKGIESTVIDLSQGGCDVLRLGSASVSDIERVIGSSIVVSPQTTRTASPGTQPRHYAPQTPIEVREISELADALSSGGSTVVISRSMERCDPPHVHLPLPEDPERAHQVFYDLLRRADETGCERIVVEALPSDNAWAALRDRLHRASTPPGE